jgi:cytochrome c-type biogenesis protein CcmH
MVAQLSGRLASEGGPPEDWAQLIRSLGVLGRRDEATAVLAEARSKHADDATALAVLDAAAREAGLPE